MDFGGNIYITWVCCSNPFSDEHKRFFERDPEKEVSLADCLRFLAVLKVLKVSVKGFIL